MNDVDEDGDEMMTSPGTARPEDLDNLEERLAMGERRRGSWPSCYSAVCTDGNSSRDTNVYLDR